MVLGGVFMRYLCPIVEPSQPIVLAEHIDLVRLGCIRSRIKRVCFPVSFPLPNFYISLRVTDTLSSACQNFLHISSLAAAIMPKVSKQRVDQAKGALYHRQNKRRPSLSRKHDDPMRGPHSGDGDCKFTHQIPSFGEHRELQADSRPLDYVDSGEVKLKYLLLEIPRSENSLPVSTTTDKIGTFKVMDRTYCNIPNSPSLNSSEASTIFDRSGDDVFARMTPNAKLEDFEFEFDSVVRIDGEQCQVRWADSIIHDSDLHSRRLHGELLKEYMSSSKSLGSGLSKVTWKMTWEPVDILRSYKDVVQRESQFEFGNVIREKAGNSLVQWDSSVVHESTLETLHGHPLFNQVQSHSCSLAHGYVEVTWRPMWVPTDIMEAYGGGD